MRRFAALSVLTALATSGLLASGVGAASAATAPAPDCDNYASTMFYCNANSPVNPVTWTLTTSIYGITNTSTFSASPYLRSNCSAGSRYSFSFSYVYGGVTYVSPVSSFICGRGSPE